MLPLQVGGLLVSAITPRCRRCAKCPQAQFPGAWALPLTPPTSMSLGRTGHVSTDLPWWPGGWDETASGRGLIN